MIYYTTVVGLDPKALATLFLISEVMDGISDPVMGFILDRFPVTKMGKFRPMLILGTIICVINYILLWFGAVWSPHSEALHTLHFVLMESQRTQTLLNKQ